MANLSINGVNVKTPKTFNFGIMDIDGETTRNAAGRMKRDRIATKRRLEMEWGHLSDSEISTILAAVSSEFFSVTYPDARTGGQATRTFYVGDRTAPAYTWVEKLKAYKWEGLSMNFIEQ